MELELILEGLWKKSRFTSYFYQGVDLSEENSIPTLTLGIYSSRLTLFYNSRFISTLNADELTGLLIHEMMHIVLNHDHRGLADGNIYLQNLAQDMVINSYIKENSKTFFSRKNQYLHDVPELILPPGLPVIPEAFFKDTSITDPVWEEIYRWLKLQPEDDIKNYRFTGTEEDNSGIKIRVKSGIEQMKEDLDSLDISYNTAPKENYTGFKNMTGLMFNKDDGEHIPTGIHIMNKKTDLNTLDAKLNHFMTVAKKDEVCISERVFNDISSLINAPLKTDLSWSEKIRSIVDITAQSSEWEYSYHRFNKRYFSKGIYAPGRSFKDKEAITVIVDVSGSMVMKPGDIESAFGIIEGLLSRFKIYLLCIDETLFIPEKKDNLFVSSGRSGKPYEYKKGDWRYLKTGSSGTTYFASLFNTYMENHTELLIVITDGFIYDIDLLRKYNNTLWLISEHRDEPFRPPFGRSIKITSAVPERRLKITGRNK
jgi:predicted metal-dependent peptidase